MISGAAVRSNAGADAMDETVTAQVLGDGTIRIKETGDDEAEPIDLSVADARNLRNQLNRLIDNIEGSRR